MSENFQDSSSSLNARIGFLRTIVSLHCVRRAGRYISTIVGFVLALGCSDINEVTGRGAIQDPTQIFARLELSYHAITLSLVPGFDTITLHTTARTPTGELLIPADTLLSPVTFRLGSSTTALRVTPQGQLSAQSVSSRVLVIATQTIGSVTLVDTAVVAITNLSAPSPAIASVSLQPLPGDSAKVDCSGRYTDTLRARLLDAALQPVTRTVSVSYRSSDPTIATMSSTGVIQGKRPGQVTLSVDAYAYGRGVRDSIRYTVGEPLVQVIWMFSLTTIANPVPMSYASPADVQIAVGGSVYWMNASAEQIDIVFDDSASARPSVGGEGALVLVTNYKQIMNFNGCAAQGSGNIPALQFAEIFSLNGVPFSKSLTCATVGARSFNQVGTYTYRSTLTGVTGHIVVVR